MLAMNFNRLKWKGRGCMNQTAFSMWLWMNDLWCIQCTLHQPCTLVSQARPNQPQRGSLSVSPCVILKAIRAGVGWVIDNIPSPRVRVRLPCTQGLRLLPCRGGALGPDTRYVTCGDVPYRGGSPSDPIIAPTPPAARSLDAQHLSSMSVDSRGIKRGQCMAPSCGCVGYSAGGDSGMKCIGCGHPPGKHYKLSSLPSGSQGSSTLGKMTYASGMYQDFV